MARGELGQNATGLTLLILIIVGQFRFLFLPVTSPNCLYRRFVQKVYPTNETSVALLASLRAIIFKTKLFLPETRHFLLRFRSQQVLAIRQPARFAASPVHNKWKQLDAL
jgi:hypothetical protein